ncbi:hypothetical protein D3C73_1010850 [compost metagenome]
MCSRGPGAFGLAHDHPAGDTLSVEPQFLQQRQEQIVEFVAVTAAPLVQDLVFDRGQIDQHRLAGQGGEVFEREGTGMTQLQLAQGFQGRRRSHVVTQAFQVQRAIAQAYLTHWSFLIRGAAYGTLYKGKSAATDN